MGAGDIKLCQIGSLELTPPSWLIHGFLIDNSLMAIYGAPSVGKTFVVLNAAGSVASGRPFFGRKVEKPGLVIYVAGEGRGAIRRRYDAWCKINEVHPSKPPLLITDSGTELCNPSEVKKLEIVIEEATAEFGPLRLLVIDTWSRNLAGDDNSSRDAEMGVKSLSRLCRPWEATGLIIAHVGHEQGRIRGSSALRGDLDQEIMVRPLSNGEYVLSQTKGRDIPSWEPFYYRIAQFDLGMKNLDGEAVTTGIVEEVGPPNETEIEDLSNPGNPKPNQATKEERALSILKAMQEEASGDEGPIGTIKASDWVTRCKEQGLSQSSFYEARTMLLKKKAITLLGELVVRNPIEIPG